MSYAAQIEPAAAGGGGYAAQIEPSGGGGYAAQIEPAAEYEAELEIG